MKKNLILIALLVSAAAQVLAQKANTVVTGKLKGLSPGEWIYIDNFAGGGRDSIPHKNGKFRYEKYIPEGEGGFFIFRVGRSYDNMNFIFLDKGKLRITGKTPDLRNAKYTGGKLANYYNLYNNRPTVEGMAAEQKELDRAFVLTHKDSPAAAYAIFFSLRGRDNLDELEAILTQVSPAAKNNLPIKQIEHSIRTAKLTGIGRTAPEFSQTDTAGKVVSLSDFRGKYVLVDFWASWCVPCRAENPNVVAAYTQYKNKNFTVLGISFDNPGQHDRWMQAIHEDNLQWTQLSDLKGWKNEVGQLYDIRSIPSNLLIDPNGVIVAKNLKGEKLTEKLRDLLGAPQAAAGTSRVTGYIEGLGDQQLMFYYLEAGARKTDSVQTSGGHFTWEAYLSEPQKIGIMFPNRFADFYAQAGEITIKGQVDSLHLLKVSGSALHDEAMAYQKTLEDLNAQRSQLYRQYGKVSDAEQRQLEEKLEQLRTAMRARARDYVRAHPESYYSFDLVNDRAAMGAYEEVKPLYDLLGPAIQQSAQGRALAERLDVLKRSAVGATMLDFTQNDTEGKPVHFADFKGKYVLVDFWASWCGPCRAENPNVLREYNKYKDRNFTVLGVSLDDNADRWKKAIAEDGMPWTQVSDLKGWENEVSTYYGIRGIPSTLLVGPDGKIIAKDLRGELLAKKLEELFN